MAAPEYARELTRQIASFGDAPTQLAELARSGVAQAHRNVANGLIARPIDSLARRLEDLASVSRTGEAYLGHHDVALAGVRAARERVLDATAKVQANGAGITLAVPFDTFAAHGDHVTAATPLEQMWRQIDEATRNLAPPARKVGEPGHADRIAAAIANHAHKLGPRHAE